MSMTTLKGIQERQKVIEASCIRGVMTLKDVPPYGSMKVTSLAIDKEGKLEIKGDWDALKIGC